MTLVAQRVADGRVLKLVEEMLTAGYQEQGRLFPTPQGTPQGGVVSPLLSNILLTPFDREMRRRGYQLTRYADDWVVTCRSRREAEAALRCAEKILATLGVRLNLNKTRIVHALLPDIDEPDEQRGVIFGGVWGEKGAGQGEHRFSPTPTRHRAGNACPKDLSGVASCSMPSPFSKVGAVCVDALVRICAGGDQ